MNTQLAKLRAKKNLYLHEHLQRAILGSAINKVYIPSPARLSSETVSDYILRLRHESMQYQFVMVQHQGVTKYVCFGVPGPIITDRGEFLSIPAEVVGGQWGQHYILLHPSLQKVFNNTIVNIRIDSGCFSGMVLGDITCDCLNQLRRTQEEIIKLKSGIIVEIPGQDGRGWGEYKMANQRIMKELGFDTIETAELFYGDAKSIDQRTYTEAAIIIKALGLSSKHSLNIHTDNPYKIEAFAKLGFEIANKSSVNGYKSKDHQLIRNVRAKKEFWSKNFSTKFKEG
jgi:GTP cyclohydrolase II